MRTSLKVERGKPHAEAMQKVFQEKEFLKSENAALTISKVAYREALRTAFELYCSCTALVKMKAQLPVLNQVHSQSKIGIAKLNAHGSASSNYEAVREE